MVWALVWRKRWGLADAQSSEQDCLAEMQSVPFIFDCWILWLMISVAAPFFALKMMVKFFYIFILSENLWI